MTFQNISTCATLFGRLSVGTVEPNTSKDTVSYPSHVPSHGFVLGSLGLTSRLEGVPANKRVIIAGKKILELLDHLNEARGKLEAVEKEMTLLRSRGSSTLDVPCPTCGTNILRQPYGTTAGFKNTKRPRLDTGIGRLKFPSIGEILEQGNPEDAWNLLQTPTGKQETSGGMDTKDKKILSSTTSMDGYPGTSCYDFWTDTPWMLTQKEEDEEWWLEGSL